MLTRIVVVSRKCSLALVSITVEHHVLAEQEAAASTSQTLSQSAHCAVLAAGDLSEMFLIVEGEYKMTGCSQ